MSRSSTNDLGFEWIETFPALEEIAGLRHGFICRDPNIDVTTDREAALVRLQVHFELRLADMEIPAKQVITGEQVHGDTVKVIDRSAEKQSHFAQCDGFVCSIAGRYPGVHVADCGALYLADPVRRVCGVVHSGKNGSELGIAGRAVSIMKSQFSSDPKDIVVQLAPCIRVPDYEIDFPAQIREACLQEGVLENQYFDCGVSTSSDLNRYYSYRMEKGKTGRHLAVLGFVE